LTVRIYLSNPLCRTYAITSTRLLVNISQPRTSHPGTYIHTDKQQFEDSLIKDGAEGGVRAANLLHDTIRDRLSRRGREYENCKIMVRAYTNLAGLSKTLARAGLIGHEARSLSPFCSNFTRAQDLFDFIDAGDKKENADNKIREMFRLFVENNQCKHIFFAGCHDNGYLSLLTPYIGKNDKITLVRGSAFSPEFSRLGLDTDDLNGLFQSNPLEGFDARRPPSKAPIAQPTSLNTNNEYFGPVPSNTPVCTHYLRGMCKFGSGCKKSHGSHSSGGDSWRSSEHKSAQEVAHGKFARSSSFTPSSETNTPAPSHTNGGYPGSGILPTYNARAAEVVTPQTHPSLFLPVEKNGNLIPVNSAGHRLDIWLPAASNADYSAYNVRITQQGKLCNEYQLKGYCTKGGTDCILDHNPVPEKIKLVLKHMVRSYPCSRKGNCRREHCNMGHICFLDKCDSSRPKGYCRLNNSMHGIDPIVTEWVPAESDIDGHKPELSATTSGDNDHHERDVSSGAAIETPQYGGGIDTREPHLDDLD
jgi:hypothetical protein